MRYLALLLFLATTLVAQDKPTEAEKAFFARYPAKHVALPAKKPKAIIDKDNRVFRTRLRWLLNGEPHFADHMRIEVWGCGTGCINFGIADLATGETYLGPASLSVPGAGRRFIGDPKSRALHMVGFFNEEKAADRWYVWNGKELKLIKDISIPEDCFSFDGAKDLPTAKCNFQPPASVNSPINSRDQSCANAADALTVSPSVMAAMRPSRSVKT